MENRCRPLCKAISFTSFKKLLSRKTSPRKGESSITDSPEDDDSRTTLPHRTSSESWFKHEADAESVFSFQKRVGKGGFSEVWLAKQRNKPNEQPVAVKMLTKGTCPVELILNEVEILKMVNDSPFIVQMITCYQTTTHYCIVMTFARRGTLHERVKTISCFSEPVARFYTAEIAEGLFFLHKTGIIHRDLNLDNVLVRENGHVVLSDFGLSIHVRSDASDTLCEPWLDGPGKPQFPAPELFMGSKYDKTVDWWAFGVILYRMVCGGFPFVSSKRQFQDSSAYNFQQVCRPEEYPAYLSPPAQQLIARLLARRREHRLGSGATEEKDVSSVSFFQHVDWCEVRALSVPAPFKMHVK